MLLAFTYNQDEQSGILTHLNEPPKIRVYEYALTVFNITDNDSQTLTAAFSSLPSPLDWQAWLNGWSSCGYSLIAEPRLIRSI